MSANLISFLEEFKPIDGVQTLLRDIVLLQAKFDNPDESDVFFKDSKDKQAEYLKLAKEKYNLLAETVNEGNTEQFDSHIQRIKDETKKFISEHEMNSITGQKVNSLNSQLEATQSFKQAKEKYGTLKPLDELMKDEQGLIQIFSLSLNSLTMTKLDTSALIFLPESESLIDSNAGFNRRVKKLLQNVETELASIELEGTEITVSLSGKISISSYPLNKLGIKFSPNRLPEQIQSRIEDVIGKAVATLLLKNELPPS